MIEKELQPSRGVYTLLVLALENSDDDNSTLHEALGDVYAGMSNSDPGLIEKLSQWEAGGLISNNEKLYLFVLFSVAKTIGPYDLSQIRNHLVLNSDDSESLLDSLERITMDVVLKQFLVGVIKKVATRE